MVSVRVLLEPPGTGNLCPGCAPAVPRRPCSLPAQRLTNSTDERGLVVSADLDIDACPPQSDASRQARDPLPATSAFTVS